jgi:hypothetical protein
MVKTNLRTLKRSLFVVTFLLLFISVGVADAAVCQNRANRTAGPSYFSGATSGGVSSGGVFNVISGGSRR